MDKGLGEFEHLLLLALLGLPEERAYGLHIREEVERRTGRDLSSGAVYTALERLESKGLVASRYSEPTPERGGRRKRLFRLLPNGEVALAQATRELRAMSRGLVPRLDALLDTHAPRAGRSA